jgi:hypothetical protein
MGLRRLQDTGEEYPFFLVIMVKPLMEKPWMVKAIIIKF